MITGVRQSKQTRHTYALDSLVSNVPNFVLGAESQSRDSLSCRWVPRLQSRHLPSVSANQRHPSGTSKLPPGHPQPILLLVPLLLVICRRQARGGDTPSQVGRHLVAAMAQTCRRSWWAADHW